MTVPAPLPQPLLPLHAEGISLETVGGKALNLAKLARAGFPVPNGFFLPTSCYLDFVTQNDLGPSIEVILGRMDSSSPEELNAASVEIRAKFKKGDLPEGLKSALKIGWRWLGAHPVAVRSSATAEDLQELSFAGLQDTYLNIIGDQALQEAVLDCWSSLWTGRAIGYRARNQIPHGEVSLCVVVQNMVEAQASGVLFSANPLTGRRDEMVIDATFGLGEALVSGQVEPDHYIVAPDFSIAHKSLGKKSTRIHGKQGGGVNTQETESGDQQALPDEAILALAKMGRKIADLYQFPQDVEWAYLPDPAAGDRADGSLHILQSRAITSLFPLPEGMEPEPLKIMFGFHIVQGIVEPLTPLGQDTMKLVLTGGGRVFKLKETLATQTAFYTAAERLWINMTSPLRSAIGYKVIPQIIRSIGPGVAKAFKEITQDPRFPAVHKRPSLRTLGRAAGFLLPFFVRVGSTLRSPDRRREEISNAFDEKIKRTQTRQNPSGELWEDFRQNLDLLHEAEFLFSDFVIPQGVPPVVAGMAPFFGILQRFSHEVAETTGDPVFNTLHLEIARGLPHNVTTEMDLNLWKTAKVLQGDSQSRGVFQGGKAADLTAAFLDGRLPPTAQQALAAFLQAYGARGLGEIDIGRPRWCEDPTHIIQVLQSYLKIVAPEMAPDVVFERGGREAEEAVNRLVAAVRRLRGGWIKARVVRWGAGRYRALGGMREAPKFFAIRMMSIIRAGLLESGRAFVQAGLLERPDDLFFLYLEELDEIGRKSEIAAHFPERIRERRQLRKREMLRRQIPRVLLSDGTAFYEGFDAPKDDNQVLSGDPVSPGRVEGRVRVVLDPLTTQLEPGEILVCPGTDPAWTPLFLAAGGLIMEVGGVMTHGSVVAREYGIPAVVGVHQATTRLETGQRVSVDGSSGQIILLP